LTNRKSKGKRNEKRKGYEHQQGTPTKKSEPHSKTSGEATCLGKILGRDKRPERSSRDYHVSHYLKDSKTIGSGGPTRRIRPFGIRIREGTHKGGSSISGSPSALPGVEVKTPKKTRNRLNIASKSGGGRKN